MHPGRQTLVLLLVLAALLLPIRVTLADEKPVIDDAAIKLLNKVAEQRLAVKTGQMKMSTNYTSVHGANNSVDYAVQFDGDKWRVDKLAVVTGPMHSNTKFVYDGRQTLLFDGHQDVALRNLADTDVGELGFDPRTLGLTAHYFCTDTVENCLGYTKEPRSARLQRGVLLHDQPVTRVTLVDRYEQQLEFWIDEKSLQVLQRSFHVPGSVWTKITTARYYPKFFDGKLPVYVFTEELDDEGDIHGRWRFKMSDGREPAKIDPQVFTVEGLNLPPGTNINDIRIHRRIARWDGKKLIPERPNAP